MLAHGGGGKETEALIRDLFIKYFNNEILSKMEDSALLSVEGDISFTTDSFTVHPLFFRGGDIGKLSVAGTVNDLLVSGAEPLYISAGFIIEEGFPLKDLERIVRSMAEEAVRAGVKIVTGDTKVVPKGAVDRLFINTSGIGRVMFKGLSSENLRSGDVIIFSGTVGDHGIILLVQREGLTADIESDCCSLSDMLKDLMRSGVCIKAMRDATRGGVAQVLNEWAKASRVCIEIEEERIPLRESVRGVCELLGTEPYHFANEGMVVIAVDKEDTEETLRILKSHREGKNSALVGRVVSEGKPSVVIKTPYGTRRVLEPPAGEILPRIC